MKLTIKDQAEIRDDMLRTLKYGLIRRGVANPNTGPGSDFYVEFTAIANEIAVVEANAITASEAAMDDSATGDDLIRRAASVGLSLRQATGSRGSVVAANSLTSAVPYLAQLVDQYGQRYEVTFGGSYANGAEIPIRALDTGDKTNRPEGEVFRWVSPPPYFDSKAKVGFGGLRFGANVESQEELRQRLFRRKRVPPRSGNSSHVADIAEESSTIVQAAFVYPALQGAGSIHVAVASRVTDTNKNRDVDTTILNTIIAPYIAGLVPGAQVTTTTVENVPVDVGFQLALPESPSASPPGQGGGWVDGTPWPPAPSYVSARTNDTTFTVSTSPASAPLVGQSITWVSPLSWTAITARILSATVVTATQIAVVIDTPFTGITVGAHIGPACERVADYLQTVLDYFALMGPGEKTSNIALLTRSSRFPRPSEQWATSLDDSFLHAITASNTEVKRTAFAFRASPGNPFAFAPDPNLAAITDRPRIFVPNSIAFYKL